MCNYIQQTIKDLISQKDFSFLMLALSLLLLPMSINLSTFTFILAIGLKIMQRLILKHKLFASRALGHSSIIGLIFVLYIVFNSIAQTGLSYTFGVFEKQFSHWTLLAITPLLLKDKQTNKLLTATFTAGVFLTIFYIFIVCIMNGITFNRYAFINIVDIHHTYISVFLLFIVNGVLSHMVKRKKKPDKQTLLWGSIALLIAFAVIFFLNSKVSIVIFTLLVLFHLFPEFSRENTLKYLGGFILLITAIFVFNKKVSVSYENALDFRLEIWNQSLKIINQNPVFGNVVQPEKELLNFQHYLNGKYFYLDSNLNSHNQYLSILLKYGFVGLAIALLFIVNMFRKLNKKTERQVLKELIGFSIIVLLVFYIENLLDRHHGIIFFTVFYNYYLIGIENK